MNKNNNDNENENKNKQKNENNNEQKDISDRFSGIHRLKPGTEITSGVYGLYCSWSG